MNAVAEIVGPLSFRQATARGDTSPGWVSGVAVMKHALRMAALLGGFAFLTLPVLAATALTPRANGPIKVAFVLSEGATVIDFSGPWEVFQDTDVPTPFELFTVAPSRTPIRTSGNGSHGISIIPDYTFADAPEPDLIVIGAQYGGAGLSEWLQKLHADNKIILSVCTGAFKLAQAGLLDGLPATTHHDFVDKLAAAFPKVQVKRSVRYVQSGPRIYTAGGLTSGIDLALHIVEGYFGHDVAQKTADYMEYQGTGWTSPPPQTPLSGL
jgi:transcriptional regulator GlxA family with amidase domain